MQRLSNDVSSNLQILKDRREDILKFSEDIKHEPDKKMMEKRLAKIENDISSYEIKASILSHLPKEDFRGQC
ncbi:MAG: hypothetical protein ACM3PZ_03110 [Bacillota bacterium]